MVIELLTIFISNTRAVLPGSKVNSSFQWPTTAKNDKGVVMKCCLYLPPEIKLGWEGAVPFSCINESICRPCSIPVAIFYFIFQSLQDRRFILVVLQCYLYTWVITKKWEWISKGGIVHITYCASAVVQVRPAFTLLLTPSRARLGNFNCPSSVTSAGPLYPPDLSVLQSFHQSSSALPTPRPEMIFRPTPNLIHLLIYTGACGDIQKED